MNTPSLSHRGVKKPRETLERIERELTEARRAVAVQEAAEKAAVEADRHAASAARVHGKPEPKPTAPAVTERLGGALKSVTELEDDVQLARAELEQALAANRPDIEKQIRQALSKARDEYREILEALTAKHAEMVAREAELAWLSGEKYIPQGERPVSGLLRPNGEPMSVSELLVALEARGRPPEPKVIQKPAPPLSQSTVGQGVFVR